MTQMSQKQKLEVLIKELEEQFIQNMKFGLKYESRREECISSMLTISYVMNEISSLQVWESAYIDAVIDEVYPRLNSF